MIKVSLTFDDGRKDSVEAIRDKLIPRGISSTLFVTTGYVDGTCPPNRLPTLKPAMTIEDVRELFQEPLVEIGLHGDQHLNEDWDIKEGRRKLLEWLSIPESHVFGFASPSTRFPEKTFLESNDHLFTQQISYMLLGICVSDLRWIRVISRKISRVFHSGMLYKVAYRNTLTPNSPSRIIYRIPVMGDITYHQLRSIVKSAIKAQENVVFMFHSITDDGDRWSWGKTKFDRFCDLLVQYKLQGTIDIVTAKDLYEEISKMR